MTGGLAAVQPGPNGAAASARKTIDRAILAATAFLCGLLPHRVLALAPALADR